MDSYYLTEESRACLCQKKLSYIASITKSRFRTIVKSMDEKLTKISMFQIGYNKKTKECATYYWSEDVRLGKKIVLGNWYIQKKQEADDVVVPLFDHYNIPFSGCDCSNLTFHNKLWSLKQRV